ncbi:MAG: glycosyltransferase [Myxococcales bacterium]|nr:glycosyltransferase [Myxococcales bacterium]
MKVFFFIPNLQQGGSERQILATLNSLPPHFEPILCLYHDEVHYRRELPADQPRYVLGSPKMTLRGFVELVRILRREQPDIVHCYRDKANFWGRLAARIAGVPVVISSCRTRMLELRYLLSERVMSEMASLVVVNSVGTAEELIKLAQVRPERIQVIHNALDTEFFRPPSAAERAEARERWGLAEGQRALLFAGRISLQKHQLGALLALDELAREDALPDDVVVLLAGRDRDPRIAKLVHRVAARRELAPRVRALGSQRDIRSLYWASDLLLMPSLWEGLPNAVLEAQACALPALVSHAANRDSIVEPGVTGVEVPTAERAALREALRTLLAAPPERWQQMGAAGRQRMLSRFAPDRIQGELLATYERLLSEHAALASTRGSLS